MFTILTQSPSGEIPLTISDVELDRLRVALATSVTNEYLTTDGLARVLNVCRRTIDRLTSSQSIPYRQIGRKRLFRLAEVEACLDRTNARRSRK